MTARDQIVAAIGQRGQIVGPVDHWRQAGARWQADPQGGGAVEVATLDHGVGEVGGADHHRRDITHRIAGRCDKVL